jgi:hypothetical protein
MTPADDASRYARIIGILLLVTIVAGGFGEFYVPSKLIDPADAAATANNFRMFAGLFRIGFAAYLVEAVCDTALTLYFYLLLRPVQRDLALLSVLFRLISTATFAAAQIFSLAAPFLVRGSDSLKALPVPEQEALALLALKVSARGADLFMVFYGIGSVILGILLVRSGYVARFFGGLFAVGGLCFVIRNFTLLLAPAFASSFMLLPMSLAVLALSARFLVRDLSPGRPPAAV